MSGQKVGQQGTKKTRWKDIVNSEVREMDNKVLLEKIVAIKLNNDLPSEYLMLTRNLQLIGFYICYNKVYGLMFFHMLL
ncbi:MAG: hypothetical protein RLZZ417_1460 [Bacteroidota bacterium]